MPCDLPYDCPKSQYHILGASLRFEPERHAWVRPRDGLAARGLIFSPIHVDFDR
jgi:hypothetical protein